MRKNRYFGGQSLELKFSATTGFFEGYASVFNVTDGANDKIMPGAFADSLLRWQSEGQSPPLLWQHDDQQPIGAWRALTEDSHGLFAIGELFIGDVAKADEAYKLLKEGVINGLSIGYTVVESHRDATSGVRYLTRLDLHEISLVTFPANTQARVQSVKGYPRSDDVRALHDLTSLLRSLV